MIRRRTVLVLGAGASKPYGLQLGGELVDQILRELHASTSLAKSVAAEGFDANDISRFKEKLKYSSRLSIDAFLESQPEFLDLGKTIMAAALLPREEESLFPPTEDWCGYFFSKILTATPDDFRQNQLSIITFNFDRSFERRLYLAVTGSFPVDSEAAANLARAFPIVHVHGVLAQPAWLPRELRDDPDAFALEYGQMANEGVLRIECARQIQIVHENSKTPETRRAKELLRVAEVVAFIGFSFNEANLRKIGCPEILHSKTVYGTCYGLGSGEVAEAENFFGHSRDDKITLTDHTAYVFLRETKFLLHASGHTNLKA